MKLTEWSGVFTDMLTQKSLQKMLSNRFYRSFCLLHWLALDVLWGTILLRAGNWNGVQGLFSSSSSSFFFYGGSQTMKCQWFACKGALSPPTGLECLLFKLSTEEVRVWDVWKNRSTVLQRMVKHLLESIFCSDFCVSISVNTPDHSVSFISF